MKFFYNKKIDKNAENVKKETNYLMDVYKWDLFIWEHDEESMKAFINQFNMFHPTIKSTGEYSKGKVNYWNPNTKLIDEELEPYFFVKSTGTH